MQSNRGTILERAVKEWEQSPLVFVYPVLGRPEGFELARRIAEEYPHAFHDDLVALLSSPSATVAGQALTVLHWMKSPLMRSLPAEVMADEREVTIGGCVLISKSIGELAREFAAAATGSA